MKDKPTGKNKLDVDVFIGAVILKLAFVVLLAVMAAVANVIFET